MNLDPEYDRHTSLLDVDRKAAAIWAQAFGRAIARGEDDDTAEQEADRAREAFESEWWGDQ